MKTDQNVKKLCASLFLQNMPQKKNEVLAFIQVPFNSSSKEVKEANHLKWVFCCVFLFRSEISWKRQFWGEPKMWRIKNDGCNKQKQPLEVFYRKAVLKSFTVFTGKHLCWSQAR